MAACCRQHVVDSIASNRSRAQVLYEYTDEEELRETLKALVVFFACNLIWGWFRPLAPGGALKLMNLTMVSLRWRFQDAWLLINYSPWPSITVGSNQSPCCFFDCLCFVTQQISNRAGRNRWEAWKLWHNPGKRSEVQRGHMADMAWPRFGAALLRRSNMSDIFAFYCRILQQEQELAYSVIRLTKRY